MRTAKELNKKLQDLLRDLWTIHDVCAALSVTPPTLMSWRNKRNLPTVIIPGDRRDTVRFIPEEIESWAKEANIPVRMKQRRFIKEAA